MIFLFKRKKKEKEQRTKDEVPRLKKDEGLGRRREIAETPNKLRGRRTDKD